MTAKHERASLSETGSNENPLISSKKLRQIYLAMLETRMLEEHRVLLQQGHKAKRRQNSTYGQEACLVSTAIELGPEDMVSDPSAGVVMDLILGAEPDSLLRHVASGTKAKKRKRLPCENETAKRRFPLISDVEDRLRMAMGAALTFKMLKQTNIVLAYVRHQEMGGGDWRRVLTLAAELELAIIFVVLPRIPEQKTQREGVPLCQKTRSCGVPGIPVDSSDAVALYRVAQESIGRTRGGDGPVLIECVTYGVEGGVSSFEDPLAQMRRSLLSRKACTQSWIDHAGDAFRERIKATKH
jgi:TPP-dependent pyruvate/acetoin dehydrogenase alpha subunit